MRASHLIVCTLLLTICPDACFAENPFKGFMTFQGNSPQVNQRGGTHPKIRVDTTAIENNIRRNKSINDALGPLGKLNVQWFESRPVQNQRNFIPGYGWVDVSEQGRRQVEAARRRIEGGAETSKSTERTNQTPAIARHDRAATFIANGYLTAIRTSDQETVVGMLQEEQLLHDSIRGLLVTDMSPTPAVSNLVESEVTGHFRRLPDGFGVSTFLDGITPNRVTKASPQSNGNVQISFTYRDGGVEGSGWLELTPIDAEESSSMAVLDIRLPSRHMSLREWYQYQLIAELPNLPLLSDMVGPGRVSQAKDVTLMLQLDPADSENFMTQWAALSEHAKTWPISEYKLQQYNVRQHGNPMTRSQLEDLVNAGVRQESIQWVQAVSKSQRR